MLNERRKRVLKAIIDEFIDSAHPVGSKLLMKKYNIPYSSATIRNEMMALEELGLLEKTHISSGRVPSEDGYKYYINDLLHHPTSVHSLVSEGQKDERVALFEQLVRVCYEQKGSFDEKMRQIIKTIAQITGYTVFYLGPSLQRTTVSQMRLVQISQKEVLVLLVSELGKIESKIFLIETLQDMVALDNIVKYMNEMFAGIPLSLLADKLTGEIAPLLGRHLPSYQKFHQEFLTFFTSFVGSSTYFSGQLNIIDEESELNFSEIKTLFNFFEDEQAMQWFKSNEIGIDIHIGEEIRHDVFRNYAVVRLTFEMPIRGHGTIGVIGPKRMAYNDIIHILSFVQQFIDQGGST